MWCFNLWEPQIVVVFLLTIKSILCTAISESLFLRLSSEFKINMVGLKQWNYVVLCLIVWVGRVTCVRILSKHLVTWPDVYNSGKINGETLIFCRNSHITSWTIRNCDEETLYVEQGQLCLLKADQCLNPSSDSHSDQSFVVVESNDFIV